MSELQGFGQVASTSELEHYGPVAFPHVWGFEDKDGLIVCYGCAASDLSDNDGGSFGPYRVAIIDDDTECDHCSNPIDPALRTRADEPSEMNEMIGRNVCAHGVPVTCSCLMCDMTRAADRDWNDATPTPVWAPARDAECVVCHEPATIYDRRRVNATYCDRHAPSYTTLFAIADYYAEVDRSAAMTDAERAADDAAADAVWTLQHPDPSAGMAPDTAAQAERLGQVAYFCYDCGAYCASQTPEQAAAYGAGGRHYCCGCYTFREDFLIARGGPLTIDAIDALDVRRMAISGAGYVRVLETCLHNALLARTVRNARVTDPVVCGHEYGMPPDTKILAIVGRNDRESDVDAERIRQAIRA